MTQSEFNELYWAHQPPEIRALRTMEPNSDPRMSRCLQLATKGYLIDLTIMGWGYDPYWWMLARTTYGYTWVPSALQPAIARGPGIDCPGTPYDPAHPPAGSIKVSLDAADYPPYDPPKPAAPAPPQTDPVGDLNYGTIYFPEPWDTSTDGTVFTDVRGKFLKHRVQGLFGFSQWWEKVG